MSDTALYIPCQLTHVHLEDSSVSTSHITTGVLVLQNHITTSTSLRWVPGIKFHLSALCSDAFLLLRHLFGVQLYAFKKSLLYKNQGAQEKEYTQNHQGQS